MSLSKNISLAFVASCLAISVVGCKKADTTLSQIDGVSFPTDVSILENSLNLRLDEFEGLLINGKISKLFDFTPPLVRQKILKTANVTRSELDSQIDQMWEQTLQVVEINGFNLDKNANDIEFLYTGRPYKIIPTSTSMTLKANASSVESKSETLAFIEQDEWYIIRLDEPAQVKIFRDSYPDFDNVDVMAPTMTMHGKEITP